LVTPGRLRLGRAGRLPGRGAAEPPRRIGVAPHTLLDLARTHDIEVVVGKRLDSPYRPGRSPAWIKHALRNRIEVVGGWLPGKGNRTNQLGAPTPRPTHHLAGRLSIPVERWLWHTFRDTPGTER
jgi:hypothetical protein